MTDSDHSAVDPAACAAPAFGLIVIGDEILSGRRQDKHLPKVIELLTARGLTLAWADYVGDDPARVRVGRRGVFHRRHRRDARRPHAGVRGGGAGRAAGAAP